MFLSQLLGWIFEKLFAVIIFILDIFIGIEHFLLNLREDTLQLFYWGRGNVFALFSQSIIVFVAVTVAFATIVGNGALWGMEEKFEEPQSTVYATRKDDIALEAGSLLTSSTANVQRVDVEEYVVTYADTIGGKTLDNVASIWGVSADSIRWANNYDANYQPKVGTKIKIPPVSGVYYTVQSGENLEILSARFKVDQATIAEVNFLPEPYTLAPGQQILLPGVNAQALIVPTKKPYSGASSFNMTGGNNGSFTPPVGPKFLSWPVLEGNGGGFSRCWQGLRSHDGIDINPAGTGSGNPLIYAAAPGRVTYAGIHCTPGMPYRTVCGGYAWVVEIDHGNGFSTIYGHLQANSIMVRAGDAVTRSQPIGRMGNTGTVFGDPGTHLHWQLNYGGGLGAKKTLKPVDPAPYIMDPRFCGY